MKKLLLHEDMFFDIPNVDYKLDTELELKGPEPGEDVGVSGLLLDLIGDIAKNINDYNQLQANLENYPEIAELIKDFADDENMKLGKIQSALKTISPNAEYIMNGAVEADQEMDPGSPIDESLNESDRPDGAPINFWEPGGEDAEEYYQTNILTDMFDADPSRFEQALRDFGYDLTNYDNFDSFLKEVDKKDLLNKFADLLQKNDELNSSWYDHFDFTEAPFPFDLNEDYSKDIVKAVRNFTQNYTAEQGEFNPDRFDASYINDLMDEFRDSGYSVGFYAKDHSKDGADLENQVYWFEKRNMNESLNKSLNGGDRVTTREALNEAHEELDFVTQARFDIFHDGDYDLNKLRDDLESLLQDGLDPIEFLGIDAEGLDAQSSYSYSVIGEVDPGNVSSISFDFGNDGNYDYSFIEDCIEKAVNNQGLNWGEYVDYEDVTYAYPEYNSLKEDFVPKYYYRVMKYLYNNDYDGCDEIELEELLMNSPQFHNMSEKTAEIYVNDYLTYYRDPREFRKLRVDESLKEDFEDYEDRLFYKKSDRLENSVEKRFPGWKIFVEGSWQCGIGSDFIYIYPPDDIELKDDDDLSIYLNGSFLDISNREILKLIAQKITPVIQANESLKEDDAVDDDNFLTEGFLHIVKE